MRSVLHAMLCGAAYEVGRILVSEVDAWRRRRRYERSECAAEPMTCDDCGCHPCVCERCEVHGDTLPCRDCARSAERGRA